VSRAGLQTFLESTVSSPDTVVHYEFMQDFRIHFRHSDGREETVPFFGLDTPKLKDVFAPSCLSCFDYTNAGADLVVGYMGPASGASGSPCATPGARCCWIWWRVSWMWHR
jgi:3,8-divinyl protochlorophyllide a 8-vinyl-reductase (ferredoxin)